MDPASPSLEGVSAGVTKKKKAKKAKKEEAALAKAVEDVVMAKQICFYNKSTTDTVNNKYTLGFSFAPDFRPLPLFHAVYSSIWPLSMQFCFVDMTPNFSLHLERIQWVAEKSTS
ncbi:hypothetical protein ACHAP8_004938 [Fusarium lateritium]